MVTVNLLFTAMTTQCLNTIGVALTLCLFHYTDFAESWSSENGAGQVEERALVLSNTLHI